MLLQRFSLLIVLAASAMASAGTTTFDGATDGWGLFFGNDGGLGDFLRGDGGNPGGNLQFVMVDTFGATLRNDTNAGLLGDYGRFGGPITFGVDIKAESIQYLGGEVTRSVALELVDYDNPNGGYPYTSVWYDLGTIAATDGWKSFSVTLDDATSTSLPAGWGGYGDENASAEPILPANRTFASVLASVDEVRFTTFVPGYFYGYTNFDVRYDNVTVQAVPEPATLATVGMGLLALRRRRK